MSFLQNYLGPEPAYKDDSDVPLLGIWRVPIWGTLVQAKSVPSSPQRLPPFDRRTPEG